MNTMQSKSVKSWNPFKSVILTNYDSVKAHGGEIIVESPTDDKEGTIFTIQIPTK
jgi:hypothetical protein